MIKEHGTIAMLCGACGAAVLCLPMAADLMFGPPDAQKNLLLLFGPIYLIWFGGSITMLSFGWLQLRVDESERKIPIPFVIGLLLAGLFGALLLIGFLGSEVYQMCNPTVVE